MTYKSRSSFFSFRPGSSLPFGQYFLFGLVAITAVVIGLAIGQGQWLLGLGALVVPFVLLYPVQFALGLFVLLIPFDSVVVLGQAEKGRTLTWFAGAGAVLILAGVGFAAQRLKSLPPAGIWWISFTLWCAATTVWALNPETSLKQLPTVLSLLGLYLVSGSFRYTKSELHAIVFLTIAGGCVAAIWAVHLFSQGIFWQVLPSDRAGMRASLIVGGRQNNPDTLAMSLILPMSLACGYFLSCRRRMGKAVLLLAMAAIALGMLLTMSRAAVVALVVILFVYLCRMRIGSRIIVPVILLAILLSFMPSVFFTRFSEAAHSGGSGRTDIWKAGLVAFKHYGLLGAGLYNFPFAYANYAGEAPQYQGTYRDPHNIYLAIGVETGIVGLFLFAGAVRSQLRPAFRFKDRLSPYNLLPATEAGLWGLLAFGMFGQILWEKAFWLALMLLTIAANAAQDSHAVVSSPAVR